MSTPEPLDLSAFEGSHKFTHGNDPAVCVCGNVRDFHMHHPEPVANGSDIIGRLRACHRYAIRVQQGCAPGANLDAIIALTSEQAGAPFSLRDEAIRSAEAWFHPLRVNQLMLSNVAKRFQEFAECAVPLLLAELRRLREEVAGLEHKDAFNRRELARGNEMIDALRIERDSLRADVERLTRELAEMTNESRNVPLCGDHAAVWFTERRFKPGDCWFCQQDAQIVEIERDRERHRAMLKECAEKFETYTTLHGEKPQSDERDRKMIANHLMATKCRAALEGQG